MATRVGMNSRVRTSFRPPPVIRLEFSGQEGFVAPGGFHDDQGGVQGLKSLDRLADTLGVVLPVLKGAFREEAQIEGVFGDINSYKAFHLGIPSLRIRAHGVRWP